MIFLRERGNLTQKDNVYYSLYEMHLDLVEQVISCHILYYQQARICPEVANLLRIIYKLFKHYELKEKEKKKIIIANPACTDVALF